MGLWMMAIQNFRSAAKVIDCLDLIDYNKKAVMAELRSEVGWEYYGGKHHESVFTKFYQCHILPIKFGIDKRRAHLSALIRNGELTKDQALEQLNEPIYDESALLTDRNYVLNKLGFIEEEWEDIMNAAPVPHWAYGTGIPNYFKWRNRIAKLLGRPIVEVPAWVAQTLSV